MSLKLLDRRGVINNEIELGCVPFAESKNGFLLLKKISRCCQHIFQRIQIRNLINNSPRHRKTAASGTSDRKIKSFPPKRFFCLSCLCFICFNPPPSRVTRLAEAPSLHVNRLFNRSFAWWRHFTTNSGLYCEANFSNCIFIPKREDKFE